MLRGVRFGVDVGSVRIGVAKCDPDGMLATPLETIAAGETAIPKIIDLIKEHTPIAVYVGNPLSLNGQVTQSTIGASEFALALVSAIAGHPEIEEIEAVACAIQNLHLSCTAYGLGGFWSTPKLIYTSQMNEFLALGEKDKCLGLFYIGYPSIDWPSAHRKPLEYNTEWINS